MSKLILSHTIAHFLQCVEQFFALWQWQFVFHYHCKYGVCFGVIVVLFILNTPRIVTWNKKFCVWANFMTYNCAFFAVCWTTVCIMTRNACFSLLKIWVCLWSNCSVAHFQLTMNADMELNEFCFSSWFYGRHVVVVDWALHWSHWTVFELLQVVFHHCKYKFVLGVEYYVDFRELWYRWSWQIVCWDPILLCISALRWTECLQPWKFIFTIALVVQTMVSSVRSGSRNCSS